MSTSAASATTKTTSLTAPWDREPGAAPDANVDALEGEELQRAVAQCCKTDYVDTYTKVDRAYADPPYNGQVYSMHSFIPSKGATPDKHGVFGFMKCRGTFFNKREAHERAEWLVRNVDSYHEIQTVYTGRPFPIVTDTTKFVAETKEVDLSKKMADTISEHVQEKRQEEKQEVETIKEREKKLLEESGEDYVQPPEEVYTTLQVKRANLMFTYKENQKKLEDIREKIRETCAKIREMDAQDSSFAESYLERYLNARREAGITDDMDSDDTWMQYIVKDPELDFDY